MKVLLVSSAGGHYSELKKLKLAPKYEQYVVCEKLPKSIELDSEIDSYLLYGTRSNLFTYFFIFTFNTVKALYLLIKIRPNLLISTGAHTCVPFFFFAKIFKIKSIYIESYAKVTSPSLTYKLIRRLCTKVIVQHQTMTKIYQNSEYFGGVY